MNSSCTTVHFERSPIILIILITNLINYRTTGVGLQRHDPHLQRLRQRGVHGRSFCRATQAACDRTAFHKKLYQHFETKFYLVCNDTILTSGGSARGGYSDVRSAARHKQHATEQLSTKSLTNILKQICLVCNDTILTSSGSARGGYMEVRSAARHKQQATEQLLTKSYTNDLTILSKHCCGCRGGGGKPK